MGDPSERVPPVDVAIDACQGAAAQCGMDPREIPQEVLRKVDHALWAYGFAKHLTGYEEMRRFADELSATWQAKWFQSDASRQDWECVAELAASFCAWRVVADKVAWPQREWLAEGALD